MTQGKQKAGEVGSGMMDNRSNDYSTLGDHDDNVDNMTNKTQDW